MKNATFYNFGCPVGFIMAAIKTKQMDKEVQSMGHKFKIHPKIDYFIRCNQRNNQAP
jgi:hypothetical protein